MLECYQKLAAIPAFTFDEASNVIGGKKITTRAINALIDKGYMHRIKKNLYTCFDFGSGDDYANRFQIASKISPDSFISFHSAFEFYGFYNQVSFDVQVCSLKRFSEFSYGDYFYKCFQTNLLEQVETIQGVKVVSVERAIVDSIRMIGKAIDIEELVKCLSLIHRIDESKIIEMLALYNQERLYRKVGYTLSFFQNELSISNQFFEICKDKGVLSNKGYLSYNDKDNLVYDSIWGLYAYGDLKKLVSKGGDLDV